MAALIKTEKPRVPSTALSSIVARARVATPENTGAAARAKARSDLVIIADVSGSMAWKAGSATKIDALSASLDSVMVDVPDASRVAFSSTAILLPPGTPLPPPGGSTALHLALEHAATYRRALVISDGSPDEKDIALTVARRIVAGGTRIDTLFIGDDDDPKGIAFMRLLAETGKGRAMDVDIVRERGDRAMLSSAIRLLALGAPR